MLFISLIFLEKYCHLDRIKILLQVYQSSYDPGNIIFTSQMFFGGPQCEVSLPSVKVPHFLDIIPVSFKPPGVQQLVNQQLRTKIGHQIRHWPVINNSISLLHFLGILLFSSFDQSHLKKISNYSQSSCSLLFKILNNRQQVQKIIQ